jgi:replication fork protection complex subunit Csm3/Swi3
MPGLDTTGPSAGGDELDDLFNYDIDVDEAFRDLEEKANSNSNIGQDGKNKSGTDLGIDEEVQVKAARKPIPKLDDQRYVFT